MPWLNPVKKIALPALQSSRELVVVRSQFAQSHANMYGYRPTGKGQISGIASVNGVATAGAIVVLIDETDNYPVARTISGAAGAYSFPRLRPGKYAVAVLDANGTYRSKVAHTSIPHPPLEIRGEFAQGYINTAYSDGPLEVREAVSTLSWSVVAGTLPAGLTLNASTGVLSGTPTNSGNFSFTVQVSEASTGRADTSAQTLNVDSDVFAANTISFLKFNDGLTDEKGISWTGNNSPTVSGGSLVLNGSNQSIETPWDATVWHPGSDPFTLEVGFTPTGAFSGHSLFSEAYLGGGNVILCISTGNGSAAPGSAGALPCVGVFNGAWQQAYAPAGYELVNGVAVNLTVERDSVNGPLKLYVDGILRASLTFASALPVGDGPIRWGQRWDAAGGNAYAPANIHWARYTKGAARYGANFTPPSH